MSASRPTIANVLADRYASTPMLELWTDQARVIRERRFWLSVLRAQIKLGSGADETAIADYEKVLETVDLESIRQRELRTHHDVMARIEEFNALAGHEIIHVGLTSRDVTENTEQLAIRESLELMHGRFVAALARLDHLAEKYRDQAIAGRSHNVPAQVTTLGKRFATAGEELLLGIEAIEDLQARYQLRGIKGPMGTAADQAQVLGDPAKVGELEAAIAKELGFDPHLHERRPGVPAVARPGRGRRAHPRQRAPFQPRHHDSPHGRQRPGDRRLQEGPGRFQRHAA